MPPKKTPPAIQSTVAADPELALIRSLADILNETGLSEIEMDRQGVRLRVSRTMTTMAVVHPPAPLHHAAPAAEPATVAAIGDHPGTVKSPMVGTVYRSSTPGAAPLVEIGSEVKEGQTLLIIEAMKTMNQIPAPRAGKITHVFVENGQPVEFGEPLVVIE
ncbi:MAG: acetyl-CoA carboxylase biotin carboxyl carrier protein [Rhizobiales bacterium]|nr:acetyl-CoA carboxylase biotin carboxyl carrier protein [Hyphomicrobiales bacterium]MBI3673695.1 acetyl-CoA carboxylase biotin carboxyl carrier protein [Hyphomicrobiales bacterium]